MDNPGPALGGGILGIIALFLLGKAITMKRDPRADKGETRPHARPASWSRRERGPARRWRADQKRLSHEEKKELDKRLFEAVKSGSLTDVESLVGEGARVNAMAPMVQTADDEFHYGGITPLVAAAYYNRTDVVELLLRLNANPNEAGGEERGGHTAIMAATTEGHVDVVRALLNHDKEKSRQGHTRGWVRDAVDRNGWTALMWASWMGQKEVAKVLVEDGADHRKRASSGTKQHMNALALAEDVDEDDFEAVKEDKREVADFLRNL